MIGTNLQIIKKQIKDVIEYSQGISDPKLDAIIARWYDQKEDFIKFFGDRLIYEAGHVEVDIEPQERRQKVDEFLDQQYGLISQYPGLYDFIKQNADNFFSNVTIEQFSEHNITIPSGSKISKAFKMFVEDPYRLDALQTAASRLIQSGKIKGMLCFSVHPLDYLSSSENTFNWRSCHSLDGQYRAGNLSYMLDSCTICCYIKSEHKQVKLPRFPDSVPWNNKKWRMLLFCSENRDALFAGRQYPFFSKELMDIVLEKYAALDNHTEDYWGHTEQCTWSSWHHKYLTNLSMFGEDEFNLPDRYVFINGIDKMEDVVEDAPKSLHYNDLLYSTIYTKPYYAWRKSWRSRFGELHPHFLVGSRVRCLCCGENYISEHGVMVCSDCYDENDYIRCADCGAIIPRDEARYIDGSECYVCEDCYNDNYMECASCGGLYHTDDLYYHEGDDCYYCRDCYNDRMAED